MVLSERARFGTKLGIILATAGSAVGLGNIWRFPFMTGQDGGAAFIMLYFCFVLILGIPGMVAEFTVGRNGSSNAARAYATISNHKAWGIIGIIGVLTSVVILGFYSVVAGWCLQYLYASMMGELVGDANYVKDYFIQFSTNSWKPILWGLGFIFITHAVVTRGVREGIEKASKILMPTLFILLIVIVIASCLLPGAISGIEFLFKPDFSKITKNVFLDALGQAFFSLSLGTACLCTYASYFKKDTNLLHASTQIALLDLLVAILAGLMIFPAAFSVGINPDSGPSLIFITLPNVFNQAFSQMPLVGYVISLAFYILLALAALTSTISMHEIGTAFFKEECHIRRRWAACIITTLAGIICILSSLSESTFVDLEIGGMKLMDFFDFITAQISMPLGAFLTCICVGWMTKRQYVYDEYTNYGAHNKWSFTIWLFTIRFICPIFILLIFLHQFGLL